MDRMHVRSAAAAGALWTFAGVAACAALDRPQAPLVTWAPYTLETAAGVTVEAEHGFIMVPEKRGVPGSRMVELHFLRFDSPAEGPPLVFLAGGPGGSGVGASTAFYPFFEALLEFGDVIAVDQRGAGLSNAIPECVTERRIPVDVPFVAAEAVALQVAAAEDCAAFWRDAGVDVSGYTAVESARDIDDLRRALGEDQVRLLGISYGARLAMTALREMPGRVDRAMLLAVEPPGATAKLPASLDAHVARIQAVIDADPGAAAAYPNIAALMRRTHERLDAEPLMLTAPDGTTFSFGGEEMRLLGVGGLTDPGNAALVVPMYAAMAEGGPPPDMIKPMMLNLRCAFDPIVYDGMEAMDYTAGVSPERMALMREQGPASIFGASQATEAEVLAGFGLRDLGEAYRAPVRTDAPTLVLTGTLDGRYDPGDEAEGLQGFSNLTHVMVINGGHNLLQQGPAVGAPILAFLRGQHVPETVTVPPPAFPY